MPAGSEGDDATMRCTIRLTLWAATLGAFGVSPALAQKQFGAAGVLCSQYVKGARTSDILYHQASNWLLGYVSGVNAAQSAGSGSPAINLTNDQVLKSAADYCAANPSATIASAAGQWYATLPKTAPEPPPQAAREDNSIRLNLEAPKIKPLLDRH
jgi:hypothetical protein